jgi:hypothetical protein
MSATPTQEDTMSTTTEHKRFTDITWKAAAPGGYLSRRDQERARGWMAQHDLAVEMAERGMNFELARLLVSAALNGMPVVVKHSAPRGEIFTETVIIDHLGLPYDLDGQTNGHMHVRKWGGAHPIYYREIIAADTPESVFEFDVRDEHHTIRHPALGEEEHTVEDLNDPVRKNQSKHVGADGHLRYDADGSRVFPGPTGVRTRETAAEDGAEWAL